MSKIKTFEEYIEENPRGIPDDMKKFVKFAIKEYKNKDAVNWCYSDNEEEQEGEAKDYISESMEALLLYKKFIKENGGEPQ